MPHPPTTRHRVARRPGAALLAVMVAVALVSGACDGSTHSDAPIVTVVTGLWPLAQAAAEIGQGNVRVVDVVPAGTDPATYTLSAKDRAEVAGAGVDVEVGGIQPSFVAAPKGRARTVELEGPGGVPYLWLNPHLMATAVIAIARAMEAADPKADPTFRTGSENAQAELTGLDADYESTLSSCPETTLVTVNNAFSVLSPRYPVTDRPVASGKLSPLPSAATVRTEVAAIRATGAKEIYNETWIPESDILAATTQADVQVGTLDTLEGPPTATTWSLTAGEKYESLMESDLGDISSALHCPNPADT